MYSNQILKRAAIIAIGLFAIIPSWSQLITTPTIVTVNTPSEDVNYQLRMIDQLRKEGVEIVEVGHELNIVIGVDHFFKGLSTTEINPACIPALNRIAALLKTRGSTPITVSAHTDNIGTDQGKFRRSQQQADTIVAYLWSQGIPLVNMEAIGCGDTHPVSSNLAVDGSAANRRIEIVAK